MGYATEAAKACLASPSLRGSGLKYLLGTERLFAVESPSLRGSGLKCVLDWFGGREAGVSLFTREWIEIKV